MNGQKETGVKFKFEFPGVPVDSRIPRKRALDSVELAPVIVGKQQEAMIRAGAYIVDPWDQLWKFVNSIVYKIEKRRMLQRV